MRHYYPNTQAIIYVIDSNDTERLSEVSEWLQSAMCEDELRNIPLLVYLNKQDLANAMSVERVTEVLKLHKITGRSWCKYCSYRNIFKLVMVILEIQNRP